MHVLLRVSSEMTVVPESVLLDGGSDTSGRSGDTPDDTVVMRVSLIAGCLMTLV